MTSLGNRKNGVVFRATPICELIRLFSHSLGHKRTLNLRISALVTRSVEITIEPVQSLPDEHIMRDDMG